MLRFLLNEPLDDSRKERQTMVSIAAVGRRIEKRSGQSRCRQIGLMGKTHGIVKASRSTSNATKTTLTAVRAAVAVSFEGMIQEALSARVASFLSGPNPGRLAFSSRADRLQSVRDCSWFDFARS